MGQKPPKSNQRVILHSDMNNFYASVECMERPELRGKPVAVCGNVDDRHGIVLAKSQLAKQMGVSTGEAVWQAKQKCRDLIVVPPNFDKYLRFSRLAREIYGRYTDLIEPYGMDECWLDVTGSRGMGDGVAIAEEIRRTITFELGLTVSIGVSFNKIFAKLGSDLKKPDAVTHLPIDAVSSIIWPLPVEELLGVGRATKTLLQRYGIDTIGKLAATPDEVLQVLMGKNGLTLGRYARGEDTSPVQHTDYVSPVKSIGHGITTMQDLENPAQVWRLMLELVQDVGSKLRTQEKKAAGIAIAIRNSNLFTQEWQCKLPAPTQSPTPLAKAAFALFSKAYSWQHPIRSVTVRAIDLVSQFTPIQYDLFGSVGQQERQERLDVVIADIRRRFGKKSIRNGCLFQDLKLPPSRGAEVLMPTGMVR